MNQIAILRAHGWKWAGRSQGGNAASNIFRHPKLPGHQIWLPWTGQGWTHCKRTQTGLEFYATHRTHDLDTYLTQITPKEEVTRNG